MSTKTLTDIYNDLKLLITSISGFEEGDEGFQICERFALSQIKHHRYLSVNSYEVKKEIEEITKKFLIHGKYDVANEFQELVKSFLRNFGFEQHSQYDVQWSLLSFLLNLANETNNSELSSLQHNKDRTQNITVTADEEKYEEIDWAQYLKEGQEDFLVNYENDSDSCWSDDENDDELKVSLHEDKKIPVTSKSTITLVVNTNKLASCLSSKALTQEIISTNWLKTNVQNRWWNELDRCRYEADSKFKTAHFHEHWQKQACKSKKFTGTVSEYEACRELLWMFYTPCTMALFREEEKTANITIRDVSIPSITSAAFKSMLSSYSEYIAMMKEIENFFDKLFKQSTGPNHKPSLTFEAYAAAMQQELLNIKKAFVNFEIKLMKQEDHNTFLSTARSLKKYLDRLQMISDIHKTVDVNWEKSPNWQYASKLLSTLYFKMQNSSNYEAINLCASLYLASISAYLNIVDIWLSEGRLEDWREEFIIYRCSESTESSGSEDNSPLEGFACRKLDSICTKDPIMGILMHKVFQMGRSVELLVTLDRVSDLWYMMDKDKDLTKTLNEECLNEILSQCYKYDCKRSGDAMDSAPLNIAEISLLNCREDLKQNVVAATNNPFLMKALENFIVSDVYSVDATDHAGSAANSNESVALRGNALDYKSFEALLSSGMALPWKKIFEWTISKVLDLKFSGASRLVKDILLREYKLEAHLKLMRSVYMMETSHVMNKFCKIIFTKIESGSIWKNSHYVSCLLEEVLSQEWPDSTSRWSIVISNIRTTKVLQAINGVRLNYAAGWPINIFLNEETLEKYNIIFRFGLKLKWAIWTLNTLRFSDLEKFDELAVPDVVHHFHIRRLESLRFWLLHAVGSIHAYLSGQVLQILGSTLEKALVQAKNLETIMTIHNDYLDNVHEHCLQTEKFEDLTRSIYKLLEMCEEIRDKWKPQTLVFISKSLDQLENDYVKYHTYLAFGLHNAVQYKDADYLTGLSSAFNCSMPST